ncbi:biotin-dependent carboxylase uncharacterized domain-containing protein [Streptoalloteichus tenebrarius]|uniref:Biotin-dependent carboxylase uncharacterized domain-containing protein n=1 Tax=Streptoalloteichus tenebrarius (strain ATCC 17920 / DSM 40477 / JCM 4838 / CBS 697.72 / NBRC 16177 / NCIMB 11028 / NRRL B-12390 / A12253. 1 / ISP 5477) TaxID=1933 RepID=A0ABT1HMX8_STRSD|nr:biotin-dependent carboxyltransferase family protein [Streptoalloteichus tenebrarius]MCP2256864.1 biotin-dependent carboxylase uncharacterized domain-containing protein [Streptoalloteichus tenebrarius]BFF00229.1 biotin-dependent carboxyltransferase family protein [Streptoalloteichus tenebrarius]
MRRVDVRQVEVLSPGILATVQDLGRPGLAGLGVGWSGAADRAAFRLANRLVGNAEDAAAVEVTFGGLAVRARHHLVVAVTGAECPVTVDGRPEPVNSVLRLRPGAELRLGPPTRGLRNYVAVRGGLDVPAVLGSSSTDVLAGIGPGALATGDVLAVGEPRRPLPPVDLAPVAPPRDDELVLRVWLGPRDDWFTPEAVAALGREPFQVTSESDRVGMRLAGPVLERRRDGELPSEGTVRGALQVPPSGQPTLFLADHPVTGGYPVIAVVLAEDVDRAAQARPGTRLRFRVTQPTW